MKKNVASQVVCAQMVSATDGSDFTGTVSVYVTGDGGTKTAGGGTVTHEGDGQHSYVPTQAETNYDHIAFQFKGTGALTATIQLYTMFPQTGDAYGIANNGAYGNSAIKTLIDTLTGYVDTEVAAILADTNELQTDWVNGGRLDLLIDAIKAKTDSLPADPADASDIAASFTTINTKLDTIDDYIDTEVAAIKAKTDSLTFTDAGKVDATLQIAADVKAAVANRIADHVIRRSLATALASGDGDTKDFRSLAGAIAKLVNKVAISGSTLSVYETDGATALGTQALTTDAAAEPITAVDTA